MDNLAWVTKRMCWYLSHWKMFPANVKTLKASLEEGDILQLSLVKTLHWQGASDFCRHLLSISLVVWCCHLSVLSVPEQVQFLAAKQVSLVPVNLGKICVLLISCGYLMTTFPRTAFHIQQPLFLCWGCEGAVKWEVGQAWSFKVRRRRQHVIFERVCWMPYWILVKVGHRCQYGLKSSSCTLVGDVSVLLYGLCLLTNSSLCSCNYSEIFLSFAWLQSPKMTGNHCPYLSQDIMAYLFSLWSRTWFFCFVVVFPGAGELFVCGHNKDGQLGLNHTEDVLCFTLCTTLSGICVKQVACGWDFTIILVGKSVWEQKKYLDVENMLQVPRCCYLCGAQALAGVKLLALQTELLHVTCILANCRAFLNMVC